MTFDGTCERGGFQRAPQEIEKKPPAAGEPLFVYMQYGRVQGCRLLAAGERERERLFAVSCLAICYMAAWSYVLWSFCLFLQPFY
jgi:hypothetical protein